jgi:photosystem II stability/assembly factor-like uncharacterized protein
LGALLLSGCSQPVSTSRDATQNTIPEFTTVAAIWKSVDGGKTWEMKNRGVGAANTKDLDVLSFAINPADSSNIYTGLRSGGILKTTNGGDAWEFINYQSEKVYGLALNFPAGETLLASGVWDGTGKMFSTSDSGQNWKEIYTSPSKGPLIISLTLDKKNPQVVYATSSDDQVFKSTDGGNSWENLYTADTPVLRVAIDSGDSNLVYLLNNAGGIFRSRDAGDNFEVIASKVGSALTGFGGNQFSVLRTDPTVSNRIYLAGVGGLIVSSDAGETWKKISILNDPQKFPIKTLAINPGNPQEIIYGASQAIYKSTDGGNNWITSQFNSKMKINVLEYDPANPSVIYAGFTK